MRTAIACDGAPKYARKPAGSIVDAVEAKIREQLQLDARMPATVIAERVGWTRGIARGLVDATSIVADTLSAQARTMGVPWNDRHAMEIEDDGNLEDDAQSNRGRGPTWQV
jgi:hypothetical protein